MTDYNKLVKALRCCASGACDSEKCDYMGMGAYGCMIGLAQDAAAAIEALQDTVQAQDKALKECARQLAQKLPKRGKWIHIEGDEPWEWRCTVCHEIAEGHGEFRFCPNCGAKMEVQDGE